MAKSPVFGPMLGCLVGTPRTQSLFSIWNVARAFIPESSDLETGKPFSFEERYEAIAVLMQTRRVECQAICPILGAAFEEDPIELSAGLVISKLSRYEIIATLDAGLMPTNYWPAPSFDVEEIFSFALKKMLSLPLVVMTQEQARARKFDATADSMVTSAYALDEIEQLRQCMAILTRERLSIPGSISRATSRTFIIPDAAASRSHYEPEHSPYISDFRVDSEGCRELRDLWAVSHDGSFRQNKALALAVRRLALGTQRTKPEDRLLDVFIAAEALYLSDTSDTRERGELKYRLALRAAVWSEGSLAGWSRRDVFKLMKTGYDARSSIAHGGVPKPKELVIKSERVSLYELVNATEDVVRAGLYKALRWLATSRAQLIMPWDDLVLPDETAENSVGEAQGISAPDAADD